MKFGYREECLKHDTGGRHPESPDRLRAIRQGLAKRHDVEYVAAEPASREAIEAIHDRAYVEQVERFCADGGGRWDTDTVAVKATWDALLASTGLARWAAEEALSGVSGSDTAFSIGRPPGHHALVDDAMGFCFFNNVAIAAQAVLEAGAERVAVLDWDVHHGNGTQDAFYDRGDVLYLSVHEDGLYPGTGAIEETGDGDGTGATVNAPLPAGCGDPEYVAVFEDIFVPPLEAFDPDLLLVSAGFDAHERDPISRMRVSTEGYGVLAAKERTLCEDLGAGQGYVLEGGYGLDTLTDSIVTINKVFDGYDPVRPDGEANERCRSVIGAAREAHGLGEK